MKLLSTLLSHDQAVCPHCDTKIGLRQISEYFLKGTNHTIQCPNCNRALRPKREPIKFYYCFCAGFISIVAPFGYTSGILKITFGRRYYCRLRL